MSREGGVFCCSVFGVSSTTYSACLAYRNISGMMSTYLGTLDRYRTSLHVESFCRNRWDSGSMDGLDCYG